MNMRLCLFTVSLCVLVVSLATSEGIPNWMPSSTISFKDGTVTFPLRTARLAASDQSGAGPVVYFIVTDTSDYDEAVRLGVNWSPKLANALNTPAVQRVALTRNNSTNGSHRSGPLSSYPLDFSVEFVGSVDFRPHRKVVPGPMLFPLGPGTQPGGVGDISGLYSPLFAGDDNIVYNGPHVANLLGEHDKTVHIDWINMTIALQFTVGFYLNRTVWYLSTDASDPDIAAFEAATYAPLLASAPFVAQDDPSVSSREAILAVWNGPRGVNNTDRQGLQSAAAGEGGPLNIIRAEPACADRTNPNNCSAIQYSPLWDAHIVSWTKDAILAGNQTLLPDHRLIEQLFLDGQLVNFDVGGVPTTDDPQIKGITAVGVVINCPPFLVDPPSM